MRAVGGSRRHVGRRGVGRSRRRPLRALGHRRRAGRRGRRRPGGRGAWTTTPTRTRCPCCERAVPDVVAGWRDARGGAPGEPSLHSDEETGAGRPVSGPRAGGGVRRDPPGGASSATHGVGLAQVGDGDALVRSHGFAIRPVPGDARLAAGETTSLCLPTAEADFRYAEVPASAVPDLVVLATDGYGNSFADGDWWHGLVDDLASYAASAGFDALESGLPAWLADSAEVGGDDVTAVLLVREPLAVDPHSAHPAPQRPPAATADPPVGTRTGGLVARHAGAARGGGGGRPTRAPTPCGPRRAGRRRRRRDGARRRASRRCVRLAPAGAAGAHDAGHLLHVVAVPRPGGRGSTPADPEGRGGGGAGQGTGKGTGHRRRGRARTPGRTGPAPVTPRAPGARGRRATRPGRPGPRLRSAAASGGRGPSAGPQRRSTVSDHSPDRGNPTRHGGRTMARIGGELEQLVTLRGVFERESGTVDELTRTIRGQLAWHELGGPGGRPLPADVGRGVRAQPVQAPHRARRTRPWRSRVVARP